MFSIFTYIMSRVTHSEPGLPMDKVVVVLAKLTLFVQSCRRSWHKVDVVCTKFCTKKEESWQVNIDIKTASYTFATRINLYNL